MRLEGVDIVQNISAQQFFEEYHSIKPLVIRGEISHWPAIRLWNLDYLGANYGETVIPVVRYDPNTESTFLEQTISDEHELMPLGEYLKRLESLGCTFAIREDSELLRLFPCLLEELDYFSPFCSSVTSSDERYKSLWIGPQGYITGLHTDPGDTLLFQILGRKHILLFDPTQSKFLHQENPAGYKPKFDRGPIHTRISSSELATLRDSVGWCAVNPFNPDLERFPLFSEARGLEASIDSGDTLYIPDQWWHAVRSLDATISVSVEPGLDGKFFLI